MKLQMISSLNKTIHSPDDSKSAQRHTVSGWMPERQNTPTKASIRKVHGEAEDDKTRLNGGEPWR